MAIRVRDRLRLAASALFGRGEALFGPYGFPSPSVRTPATLLQAYKTTPPLQAVTNRMATGITMSGWHLYGVRDLAAVSPTNLRGLIVRPEIMRAPPAIRRRELAKLPPENLIEIPAHPLLTMIRSGNPFIVGVSVMEMTQLYLDITGRAFWMLESRRIGSMRVPYRIWPIAPHWVKRTPAAENDVYEVTFPSGRDMSVAASDMVWFHRPDLLDPYRTSSGIGGSLGDEMDFMESGAKLISTTFLNKAIIPWVGQIPGASGEALKKIQARIMEESGGFIKSGKPFLMDREMKITQLAQKFEELELVNLLNYGRDSFIHTYGVPPEILGLLESSNRATSTIANEIHARWNLDPRLNFLRATMQERLVPMYDERLWLEYDSPLMEDSEFTRQVMQNHQQAFTMDEIRKQAGHGPDPSGKGHYHWLPQKGAWVDLNESTAGPLPN